MDGLEWTWMDLNELERTWLNALTFIMIESPLPPNSAEERAAADRLLEVLPMTHLTTPWVTVWILRMVHHPDALHLHIFNLLDRILRIVHRVAGLGKRCSSGWRLLQCTA